MEALKTILKWALPSSKFAYKMLATSAEVFCRHRFGRRYLPTMLFSFVTCMAVLNLFSFAETPPCPGLVDAYLLIFFALLLYHFVQMRRTGRGIHSTSSGQSWPFWSRFNLNPSAVKILIEPLINFLAGVAVLPANRLLAVWLQLAGICLFIKGSMAYNQFRNRVQDTIDARLDGEGIGTAARQQAAPQRAGENAVATVELAEPAPPPANTVQQIYARLDPALQQLMAAQNQNVPETTGADQPELVRVIVRGHRQMLPTPPPPAPIADASGEPLNGLVTIRRQWQVPVAPDQNMPVKPSPEPPKNNKVTIVSERQMLNARERIIVRPGQNPATNGGPATDFPAK
jgi:hypothetical protein